MPIKVSSESETLDYSCVSIEGRSEEVQNNYCDEDKHQNTSVTFAIFRIHFISPSFLKDVLPLMRIECWLPPVARPTLLLFASNTAYWVTKFTPSAKLAILGNRRNANSQATRLFYMKTRLHVRIV